MFSRHISRTQSFQENRLIIFQVRVVLKPLVSLIGHLIACSARISVDTHTHTHTHTDRQNDYCNPRCACAPRVNKTTLNNRAYSLIWWAYNSHESTDPLGLLPLTSTNSSGVQECQSRQLVDDKVPARIQVSLTRATKKTRKY